MSAVLIIYPIMHKYYIKLSQYILVYKLPKHLIHWVLECIQGVCESEGLYRKLKKTIVGYKGSYTGLEGPFKIHDIHS